MVGRQAPLPVRFSWQEYWSGLPCPSLRIFPTQGSSGLSGGFFTTEPSGTPISPVFVLWISPSSPCKWKGERRSGLPPLCRAPDPWSVQRKVSFCEMLEKPWETDIEVSSLQDLTQSLASLTGWIVWNREPPGVVQIMQPSCSWPFLAYVENYFMKAGRYQGTWYSRSAFHGSINFRMSVSFNWHKWKWLLPSLTLGKEHHYW